MPQSADLFPAQRVAVPPDYSEATSAAIAKALELAERRLGLLQAHGLPGDPGTISVEAINLHSIVRSGVVDKRFDVIRPIVCRAIGCESGTHAAFQLLNRIVFTLLKPRAQPLDKL